MPFVEEGNCSHPQRKLRTTHASKTLKKQKVWCSKTCVFWLEVLQWPMLAYPNSHNAADFDAPYMRERDGYWFHVVCLLLSASGYCHGAAIWRHDKNNFELCTHPRSLSDKAMLPFTAYPLPNNSTSRCRRFLSQMVESFVFVTNGGNNSTSRCRRFLSQMVETSVWPVNTGGRAARLRRRRPERNAYISRRKKSLSQHARLAARPEWPRWNNDTIFKNFANILVQLIPDLGVCVVWTAHAPQHT